MTTQQLHKMFDNVGIYYTDAKINLKRLKKSDKKLYDEIYPLTKEYYGF